MNILILLKRHKIVSLFKTLRKSNNIGYDALMSLAIRIEKGEEFVLKYDLDNLDKRWTGVDLKELQFLLNDFVSETDFISFFDSNKKIIEEAKQDLRRATNDIDYSWFNKFYGGTKQCKYKICAGLLLGANNYGPKFFIEGKEERYSILGASK